MKQFCSPPIFNYLLFTNCQKEFLISNGCPFLKYIIISGLSDYRMRLMAEHSLGNEPVRRKIAELLKLVTRHKQFNKEGQPLKPVNFYMRTGESEGTQKMFGISPAILESLETGRVLVMDEFDARFHPLLNRKIVELYNSVSNKNAQFIFATHDTNLLTPRLLRKDQICFVEKDQQGASHFYSLVDFKGVRFVLHYQYLDQQSKMPYVY